MEELAEDLEDIKGSVKKIVFQNPENEWTVLYLTTEDGKEITAVGKLLGIYEGENLHARGKWTRNAKFGKQFEIQSFRIILPSTEDGLEKYLSSGLIKGIGKEYAKRIIKKFKMDTIHILDEEPEKLRQVEGIGEKRIETIQTAWKQHRDISEIIISLQSFGISTAWAVRIYKFYKEKAAQILKTNPYQIAIDISGIGFKTADQIAQKLGIPQDSIERAEAGLLHIIFEYSEEGNTYCPYDILIQKAEEMLQISVDKIRQGLKNIYQKEKVKLEKLPSGAKTIYAAALYHCESQAAINLQGIINYPKMFPQFEYRKEIDDFQKEHEIDFAEEQIKALEMVFSGRVSVITGGPGTGKTTLVRAIIEILEKQKMNILLASPTGRASKRLSETTGRPAFTIHRLLKYKPETGKFLFNEYNKLPANLIIIDETSMIDIVLMHNLLKAVDYSSSIVFVGDVDQLPSVGPGNVLKDMIASGKLEVTRLTKIFRQAQRSLIVQNAHKINSGEFPYIIPPDDTKKKDVDFFFIQKEEPFEALEAIKDLITTRIPLKFKFDPVDEVQVISPMYKGLLGVQNLNKELQIALNPDANFLERGFLKIGVGDKVIQNKNNYDKDVFNGDIGVVRSINRIDHSVKIGFYGKNVIYEYDELDEISLAYAISVHKSQGSEYKAVVIPVHTQHFIMLQKNLLYTAVTRGKKLVCLVGTKKALAIAVKNNKINERFSGFAERLNMTQTDSFI